MTQEFIQGRLVEAQRSMIERQDEYITFLEGWSLSSLIGVIILGCSLAALSAVCGEQQKELEKLRAQQQTKDPNGTSQREVSPRPAAEAPTAP